MALTAYNEIIMSSAYRIKKKLNIHFIIYIVQNISEGLFWVSPLLLGIVNVLLGIVLALMAKKLTIQKHLDTR